jgi:hypothetical protein
MVPSNHFGGRNIPLMSSLDRHSRTRTISIQRDKVVSEESKIGSTIEHKIEASIIVGQEEIPLEPSTEPNNTTFVLLPPSRDPNFVDIIFV